MIDIKDQVCSLELAKELEELGVRQLSYFYWVKAKIPNDENDFYCGSDVIKEWPEYFLISNKIKQDVYLDTNHNDELTINSYGCGCCHWSMEIAEIYSAFTLTELRQLTLEEMGEKVLPNSAIESSAVLLIDILRNMKNNENKLCDANKSS